MAIGSSLSEEYRELYCCLKSDDTIRFINDNLPQDAKKILSLIRSLPHPSVASEWDIYDVAKLCVSGHLEYLYDRECLHQRVGELAKRLLNRVRLDYPYVELSEYRSRPTKPPKNPEIADIAYMLSWANNKLSQIYRLSYLTKSQSDITMKGQCPFCHGDLVTYVVGQELRLRCKNRTNPECTQTAWQIGIVKPTTP